MTVGRCDPFAWQVRSFCCEMLALSPLSGAFQNHRSNSIRYAKNGSNDNNSMGRQAGLATKAQRHKGAETQRHRSTEAHRQTNTKPKPKETQPQKQTNKQTHKPKTQAKSNANGWTARDLPPRRGRHKDHRNANNKQMNKPQGAEAQRQPPRDTTPQGHNTTQTKNHNNRTTTQRHKGTRTPKRKGQEPPQDKDTETQRQR